MVSLFVTLSFKVTNTIRHTAFIVFVIIEKLPCTRCLKLLRMIAIHRRLIGDGKLRLFNHDGGNLFTVMIESVRSDAPTGNGK